MATVARNSARFHSSQHENLNKPFAESIDCSPPSARALMVQSVVMIGAVLAVVTAAMWLVSNG